MIFLDLFWTFFKIGAFTFGGGYAMLPLIQEAVLTKGWAAPEALINFIAVSESTPGPFAINMATYVGAEMGGVFGSFCATLGVVLPSFVLILLLSFVLAQFQQVQAVQYAFHGIRAGVLVLMLKALTKMLKSNGKGKLPMALMLLSFVLAALLQVNTILVIVLCGLIGLAAFLLAERGMQK